MQQHTRTIFVSLVFFALFLILGGSMRHYAGLRPTRDFNADKIERLVNSSRTTMLSQLERMPLESYTSHEDLWRGMDSIQFRNMDVLVFQGFELVAWSNRLLPVDGINPQYFKHQLVRLDNGWYLTAFKQHGQVLAVGFTLLKHEFPYQNQFLQDGFPSRFGLESSVMISREQSPDYVPIRDDAGNFLFSFIPAGVQMRQSVLMVLSGVSFLLGLVAFWVFIYYLQAHFRYRHWINLLWVVASGLYGLIYYLLIWRVGLSVIQEQELFSPVHFAMSAWLPSLGHFLLYVFLLFSVCFWFFKFFRLPVVFRSGRLSKSSLLLAFFLFLVLCAFYLIYISRLFYMLAEHSSGSMVLIKVIDMDLVALVKIVMIAFLLLSFLLIFERVVLMFVVHLNRLSLFATVLGVSILFSLVYGGVGVGESDWAFVFYLLAGSMLIFLRRKPHLTHSYSTYIWFAGLFALYAGMVMMDMTIRKEESNRELLIENLSFQLMRDEDPVAEMYLSDIEKQISNDATLMRLLAQPDLDPDAIRNHLVKFYFYGYWGRYEMQIIPCWPQGDLFIQETGEVRNCYNYFFQLLDGFGYTIPGSNHFHFLDNHNGRVSYFGVFRFFPNDPVRETSLFIELHSKAFFEGLGYPELLISDREQARLRLFNEYSHAKYINGRLVKRSGDYPYKSESHHYKTVLYDKVFLKEGDYSHLVYQPDEHITVLLSRKDYTVSDVFMAFSIFFIIFFLAGSIIILLLQWRSTGFSFRLSIQKRIQVAFVLLMLVMLVIVATGTVYYTVQQFKRKHLELLENKIQSVLLELEYKIGFDGPETSSPEEYLNYQLQMISNVFYCDINLYGIDGKLLGTSRPELFKNGLAGLQMNPRAYFSLAYTDAVRFLDEERIGNLRYTSFYVPVLSNDNRLAGFVNLPYFVGNNELREEVSSVIVTVINFYLMFSFLVIGLAVFLARQITRPLLMLQDRISRIKLDRLNEKIDYKADDEIGELVQEYNRMVEELAVSAEKLAKTERELAWREMAKQIAHEIKNPLTPMKLSIQYLQRAWNDKVEDFDDYLKRVTNTLVEQINNLSSIASEFSKFAQMPSAKVEVVNLVEKVENCCMLFSKSTKTEIRLNNTVGEEILVNADGEQLLGVFNNLIKNAIQSIPSGQKGVVNLEISIHDGMARVTVSDNGKGIAEENRNKLFVPSFTTKTGGMGLGLAIARRIIENAGGEIWFESTEGVGSVFYVELPYVSDASL